jgi:CspA family cold shock protein
LSPQQLHDAGFAALRGYLILDYRNYGFIAPETGGDDAFVHISAVERAGMSTLNKDQRVSYELETDQRGKTSAVNLQAA